MRRRPETRSQREGEIWTTGRGASKILGTMAHAGGLETRVPSTGLSTKVASGSASFQRVPLLPPHQHSGGREVASQVGQPS
eukprot:5028334-Pyramimonas_sp.AAC.1